MIRKNAELLRDVLTRFIRESNLNKPLLEKRLIDGWSEVLGKSIMSYTTEIFIKNEVLYVKLSSSVLRHDLFMSKTRIIDSLNHHAGANVIRDIIFR